MKKVLITGVNGFVGQHLARELSEHGIWVVGVGGSLGAKTRPPFVDEYKVIDLMDPQATEMLDFTDIDGVVHLAGLASVGPSFADPDKYMQTNVGIQTNLFERALAQGAKPIFLIVSTGGLYDASAPLPLTENSEVKPSSPYASSKIGQEQNATEYGKRGFECIIARPFNHIGPGQNTGFLVADLAQQIVEAEQTGSQAITAGNLDAERDYTDVRDIARAYRLLLSEGSAGEVYNICSGKPVSGHTIVSGLLKASGSVAQILQDPAKMRPADNPIIYGDCSKLQQATGWIPEIPLDQTLDDVIADWRERS